VSEADIARGIMLFDALRARVARLRTTLETLRTEARANLTDAATPLTVLLAIAAALILLTAAAAILVLRRVVTLPLGRLSSAVRTVVDGDFEHPLQVGGPREIASLAVDTDAMRTRILEELSALRRAEEVLRLQAEELQRSNAELEQFAYVASHDLQEPLRKIVSFNQMLQKRYQGQLDERADQYIGFAVDGARRMQVLINDLLAFSRVGRIGGDWSAVPANELVDAAVDNLGVAIEETGATVECDALPEVNGDRALLTLVFQNLIGNAIKFHGEEPPHVRITVASREDEHEFTVQDNGIGIDPEYAERIFVIFQRLHARSSYEGTGIGLAMCRKIIEYHGGRIWLDDTTTGGGTTFHFTLPRKETA
jgi:light-regulated signal transduction histidine kinase (bacteriophytochrome)